MVAAVLTDDCIQTILTVSNIYKTREWFLKKSRDVHVKGQSLLNFL